MPENAPPLYDLFQSTRTRCGAVSKWISGRISAILDFLPLRRPNFSPLEQPLRRSLSNFVRENTSCQIVPYMDVIEIVSSEDEDDIEVEDDEFNDMHYSDTDTGQWLSTELFGAMRDELGPQSYDYASVRQVSFPRSASDATSTNQHSKRSLPSSFQKNRSKTNVALLGSHGGPTLNTAQKEILLLDDDHQTESTSYAQDSRSHEKLKQDASKRVFPSSFQPIAKLGSKIPSESKSTSDFDWMSRAYHGSTHNRQGALPYSFNNGKFIASTSGNSSCLNSYNGDFKDKFSRPGFNGAYSTSTSDRFGSHRLISEKIQGMPRSSAERRDDYYAYGTPGVSRVLPSSMLQGKYNNFQKSGFNDAEQHLGHGEDRGTDHGERLIFQQALQNLNQPKIEDDLPDGLLAVPLLKHQKIALAWMVKKEQGAVCTGGILADDQGLGKTISMIALIQKQRSEQLRHVSGDSNDKNLEALNIDDDDEGLCQPVEKQMPTEADYNKHDILGSSSKYIPLDVKMIPTRSDDTQHAKVASKLKCSSGRSRLAGGTLVVCPASILRQWARELDEKIPEGGKLSVLVYHGGSRTKHAHDLTKYDVVLTTYAIVVNEVPKQSNTDDSEINEKDAGNYGLAPEFCAKNKRKQKNNDRKKQKKKRKGLDDSNLEISGGALARVRWFRVILDEAQTIKNFRTLVASACCSLRAKRRWCLSGTPIQNTVDDLFSYFRFLKFEPYDSFGQFSLLIKHPISRDPVNGYKKLQAVLKTMLLRRTKGTLIDGQPVLKLPPKSIDLVKIDFEHEEREFYSSLEADTRKKFKAFDDAGTVSQNYASILVLLLRLRQACDHPFLVNSRARSDTISKESSSIVKQLPKDMVINLLNHLEGSSAICVLCSDPPEDPVVSMCGHVFCYQCVSDRLTGEDNSCPSSGCRNTLGADLVFSKSTLRSCSFDNFDTKALANFSSFNEEHLVTSCSFVSSKIRAAIGILNKLSSSNSEASLQNITGRCSPVRKHNYIDDSSSDANATSSSLNSNPGVPFKAIVFSQWTGMLDLLEQSLNQELIQYRRLDGSMPLHLRDMAVKEFNTDPEVVVMLMSLKAGCLGLNMVAACHVILLDLWWNPTTEDQAIDRAHRIGQTRPVTVSRLTITNTVEDRILALQESKRNMVASCFGEDASGGHASRLTVDDLRFLFNG